MGRLFRFFFLQSCFCSSHGEFSKKNLNTSGGSSCFYGIFVHSLFCASTTAWGTERCPQFGHSSWTNAHAITQRPQHDGSADSSNSSWGCGRHVEQAPHEQNCSALRNRKNYAKHAVDKHRFHFFRVGKW